MKITKQQLRKIIEEELAAHNEALLNVPGVDSMPPGYEFVGPPQLPKKTIEDRVVDIETDLKMIKKKMGLI